MVEVSFPTPSGQVVRVDWDGFTCDDLGNLVAAGSGSYRLRCTPLAAPAAPAGETVLKQTDQYGALHRGAGHQP